MVFYLPLTDPKQQLNHMQAPNQMSLTIYNLFVCVLLNPYHTYQCVELAETNQHEQS